MFDAEVVIGDAVEGTALVLFGCWFVRTSIVGSSRGERIQVLDVICDVVAKCVTIGKVCFSMAAMQLVRLCNL